MGKLSIESALKELELIVGKLESGEEGLEESLKLFDKGVKLANQCSEILTKAEQKITDLSEISLGESKAYDSE